MNKQPDLSECDGIRICAVHESLPAMERQAVEPDIEPLKHAVLAISYEGHLEHRYISHLERGSERIERSL